MGASFSGKFIAKGAGLSSKALRSAAVGGITSGIYSAAQSDADNLADIAADGLSGAGVGAAIGGAFPIATAGISKGAKAGLRVLRGAAACGKKIIENTPLKPLLTRTQDQLDDGVASLSKGSGEKELLGSAIRDGLDDELAAVNRYQKGLYDKAYAGIDKKADIKTANTEAIIKELRDEVTEDGRAYLNKILKNLRVEKRLKDLPQRDFGGLKPSNPAEVTANPTALRGLQHDAIGGFNSRVFTGDKANLATPSGNSSLTDVKDIVKDNIKYKLSGFTTDNFDDVANYLKNIKPDLIERLKGLNKDELKTLAQKLADDEIKKETIKGIRDAGKMIVQGRGKYVHTLPATLSKTDVATQQQVKGELKEYLIKKYGNEVGSTVYDTVIKKNGILDTKFVNDKGNDSFIRWLKHSIEKDSTIPINEGSVARFPTGNTMNLTTPSVLRDSVPNTTDIVKDKILTSLNANKKVMAYPNITQLQSLKSEIRIINPKKKRK